MTKTTQSLFTSAILAGALATAGCAGPMRVMYVEVGPPVPVVEVRPACPEPDFVWIDGYWGWRAHDYHWVRGYWARPPHPGWVWAPGAWARADRGWRWHDGHWRAAPRVVRHRR